jgi:hypothetical protein
MLSTSTVLPAATASTAAFPACVRDGPAALAGVVELLPSGWSDQTPDGTVLTDVSNTFGRVYGSVAVEVPPYEGPGRLVLYETFPANDDYLNRRIEQSRKRGGEALAVAVCGEATKVWLDRSSGELFVGWTDRDKTDVLVSNTTDFTVQDLVNTAERVYDCCG